MIFRGGPVKKTTLYLLISNFHLFHTYTYSNTQQPVREAVNYFRKEDFTTKKTRGLALVFLSKIHDLELSEAEEL